MKTQLIISKKVNETIENLMNVPVEYNLVSEIAKKYNFKDEINKLLKEKFSNNQLLPPSKMIGDIKYFKNENKYIIFLVIKNKDKQLSTHENIYVTLLNLKQFCKEDDIKQLATNKLCQADNLEWETARLMIRYIFRQTDIAILICTGEVEYTKEEKLNILKQFHDSKLGGHLGENKTIKKIQNQFIWKNMKSGVKNYVKNCTSYQKNKITNRHVKQPLAITSTSSIPFEKIFLYIVGPLTTTFIRQHLHINYAGRFN
jgi:hypothetical protein